jgi:hypothetical protein
LLKAGDMSQDWVAQEQKGKRVRTIPAVAVDGGANAIFQVRYVLRRMGCLGDILPPFEPWYVTAARRRKFSWERGHCQVCDKNKKRGAENEVLSSLQVGWVEANDAQQTYVRSP